MNRKCFHTKALTDAGYDLNAVHAMALSIEGEMICVDRDDPKWAELVARRTPIRDKTPRASRGLGDTISRIITTALGITPCNGCSGRANLLNRLFPYR